MIFPVLPSSADVVAALAYHSPASVFSARVTAALARISLPASTPRSDWPPSVSERVFAEMREATPADLVRRRVCYSFFYSKEAKHAVVQ